MADGPVLDLSRQSHSGLDRWGGKIQEEWLSDLRGAAGVKVYAEMSDNEPVVGGLFFAIRNLIRGLDWTVVMDDEEADLDERGVFIEECMKDMGDRTWDDVIDEALSMFEFGWSALEIIWKIRRDPHAEDKRLRSKHTDGKIGWRKLSLIGQETLDQWLWDEDGDELLGLVQYPDYTMPSYLRRRQVSPQVQEILDQAHPAAVIGGLSGNVVPRAKFMLVRTTKRKENPEGRSLLRNAYRPWYFKKNIEIFEAIGAERDLAGLPVLQVPAEIMVPNPASQFASMRSEMEDLVSELRRDELEGVLVPNEDAGYKLDLLRGAGPKQFDTEVIIKRKSTEILISVLADFIMVGHGETGSLALNVSKVGIFTEAVNAYVGAIEEVLQQELVIPTLTINGMDTEDAPRLEAGRISVRDASQVVEAVTKMAANQLLPFDPQAQLTNELLRLMGVKEIEEDEFKPPPQPVIGPAGAPQGAF